MKVFCLFVLLSAMALLAGGCETTQEGSSLPWSQPEPWEQNIGIEEY